MEKSGAQEDKVGLKAVLGEDSYPVRFSVEYPESRNRLTVLVRPILAVPIVAGNLVETASSFRSDVVDCSDSDDRVPPEVSSLVF